MTRNRYLAVCAEYGDPGDLRGWAALWDMLHDRPDWYFEPPDRMFDGELANDPDTFEPSWCFGPPGHTCHLSLYIVDGRFALHIARTDSETVHDDLAPILVWLDAHEDQHREFTKFERDSLEMLHRHDWRSPGEEGA